MIDACTINNIRVVIIFIVLALSAVGLWTFHSKVTCKSAIYTRNKNRCVQKYSVLTVGLLGAVFGVTTLYIMNTKNKEMRDVNLPLDSTYM